MDDLIDIRIQASKVMLKGSNRSLKQIAYACGFQNEYYFSKMFKSRVGTAPSSYR